MKYPIILFIVAVLFGCIPVKAQVYPKTNEDGKFGYVDDKGTLIVPFELQEAGFLKNGMAKFKKNGKYGFINSEGKIVSEPKYAETGSFNVSGYCWVCADGKLSKDRLFNGYSYGIINKEGQEIIPPKYAEVGSFGVIIENDVYYMYDGKEHPNAIYPNIDVCAAQTREKTNWMHIPSSELPISAIPYFWYSQEQTNMRVGLVDKDGNTIFENNLYYTVFPPSDGMILLRIKKKGSMYIAYFNIETGELHQLPFDPSVSYHPFRGGVAKVSAADKSCYFINKQMEKITPLLKNSGNFQNGLCPVQDSETGLFGVIDSTGTNVVPYIYKGVGLHFSEGLLKVKDSNGWGCIDETGKVIIPMQYSEMWDFKFGWSAVKKNGKWGYIDKNDTVVVPLMWESIILIKKPQPSHLWCKKGNKWYSYSYRLKRLNFEQGYDDVFSCDNEKYFIVSNNKKFGAIDMRGTEVVPITLEGQNIATAAIEYMEKLRKPVLGGIDLYRYLLYSSATVANNYKLSDVIPAEMWDY